MPIGPRLVPARMSLAAWAWSGRRPLGTEHSHLPALLFGSYCVYSPTCSSALVGPVTAQSHRCPEGRPVSTAAPVSHVDFLLSPCCTRASAESLPGVWAVAVMLSTAAQARMQQEALRVSSQHGAAGSATRRVLHRACVLVALSGLSVATSPACQCVSPLEMVWESGPFSDPRPLASCAVSSHLISHPCQLRGLLPPSRLSPRV